MVHQHVASLPSQLRDYSVSITGSVIPIVPGHFFEKALLVAGVVFILAAVFGWKMPRAERIPTGLTGSAIVLMELRSVITLPDMAEHVALLTSAIALWAGVIVRLRRRKPGAAV